MKALKNLAAPALPLAPDNYDASQTNLTLNNLRLYTQAVNTAINALLGQDGGGYLELPLGNFYDTTAQVASAINTPQAVTFNTTNLTKRAALGAPTSRVVLTRGGYYRANCTLQFSKATAGNATATVWLRVNGVDVAGSATAVTISGSSALTEVSKNFVFLIGDGGYFEIVWAVSDTGAQIVTQASSGSLPQCPGAILSVTYASLARA